MNTTAARNVLRAVILILNLFHSVYKLLINSIFLSHPPSLLNVISETLLFLFGTGTATDP